MVKWIIETFEKLAELNQIKCKSHCRLDEHDDGGRAILVPGQFYHPIDVFWQGITLFRIKFKSWTNRHIHFNPIQLDRIELRGH